MEGKLIVSESGRDRIHEICDEVVVIGRGATADLHLRDPEVSGAHCEVRLTGSGYKLVDLESASGTVVNGKTVNQHLLQNGDTIQVGKARLTFLGESAKPPAKPKAAAPPRPSLTAEDGEAPKRFYRHESRAKNSASLVLLLLGLGLVIAFIVWKGSQESRPDETEKLRYAMSEARAAYEKKNVEHLDRAFALLQEIPEGTVNQVDFVDAVDEIKSWKAELVHEQKVAREREAFERIQDLYAEGGKDQEWLRLKIASFQSEYPNSHYLATLHRLRRASGTPNVDETKAWNEAARQLSEAMRAKDFALAYRLLARVEANDTLAAAFGDHIAIKRTALDSAFQKHYEELTQEALKARAAGDPQKARRFLKSLVDVGQEPYSTQAKALLDKIR